MSGANSTTEALDLQAQLIQMLSSAGLVLRKWASNCNELTNLIQEDLRLPNASLSIDDGTVKTLGKEGKKKTCKWVFITSAVCDHVETRLQNHICVGKSQNNNFIITSATVSPFPYEVKLKSDVAPVNFRTSMERDCHPTGLNAPTTPFFPSSEFPSTSQSQKKAPHLHPPLLICASPERVTADVELGRDGSRSRFYPGRPKPEACICTS
ncbi:hypothetical protein CEXT_397761 [Caerostris extrusa]|uniref:Uncharacterized protein n=1 Tax=Caerostris extrusa TaxID=172846 RepID=A0AAV4XTA1_CAEEX|nr:hypothetical protein CEXT_397761 [Caerostris extrusa]